MHGGKVEHKTYKLIIFPNHGNGLIQRLEVIR